MFLLKTEHSFDAAHFLAGYEGKCRNIHGHRWRVVLEVCGTALKTDGQQRGMLVDFSHLKQDLREVVDTFDHTLIVEKGSLSAALDSLLRQEGFSVTEVPFRPTAEEFARYFYEQIAARGYDVARSTVYETPANCAEYLGKAGDPA
ncbi:MAG: 6-carboxytetrahydropterin synthase QueD [Clostridiales bacterium]|nr:6-carboxytetrahydropterin synthase QueD [Clostridiales bacterium]